MHYFRPYLNGFASVNLHHQDRRKCPNPQQQAQICPLENSLSILHNESKSCHNYTAVQFQQKQFYSIDPCNLGKCNFSDRSFFRFVVNNYFFAIKSLAIFKFTLPGIIVVIISVTSKKSPNVNKSCPKMIDFGTFTKIVYECRRFGQTNCCHRL